jgi:hypothetical protein
MIGRERINFQVQCTMRVDHLLWVDVRVTLEPRLWAVLEVLASGLERQA